MATSYALPPTALPHTHSHGHSHIHSHAHSHSASPARSSANTTRSMKHERSSGSLHSSSHSESHLELDHNHTHVRDPGHLHTNSCSHHVRESSPLAYPTPPNSDGLPPAPFGHHVHEHSPALSQLSSYEPHSNAVETVHQHHDDHGHDHDHSHTHTPAIMPRSKFTTFVIPYTQRFPLLYTIMADKDSRRILYFIWLNFTFMLVQAFYGFVTDSLGLLSDSIHMLFDCLALGVGLFASVASKWPPSERFPYGFGKIESLSGFGNGVFLMLISMEIMIEAVERLAEGRPTKRLLELFVVSAMGLAVNLVGMACFGHHGHHGHDHGHAHGHSHSHEKAHSHDEKHSCGHSHDEHAHDHEHDHDHSTPLLSEKAPKAQSHSHSHSHDNENMHGIFLHVLADTMGSAAVMVSTALIYFFGWNGFDPLASCIIAVLIFMSSIPLIKSCAKKLLLTVPADSEYTLRETLASVSGLRGVAGYTVPRFWMGDNGAVEGGDLVLGVMHIQATRGSDLEDVKERARILLQDRGMDVVIQVEGVTETGCWCSGMKELNARRYS